MGLNRATGARRPRVLITVQAQERADDPELTRAKNERYVEQLRRAGADPVLIDETAPEEVRASEFAAMDGLLLSGGTDLDPALYGEAPAGAVEVEPGRDALERAAWRAARERQVPVLGICRGLQAVNVFSGGKLVQHLEGHRAPPGSKGPPHTHPMRLVPGSRLARILRPTVAGSAVIQVNSFHHQGVRRDGLAPGYLVAGTSPHPGGDLVEAFESQDPGDFVLAVQCHPERTESTPREFERLWTVFVDACSGSATGMRVG